MDTVLETWAESRTEIDLEIVLTDGSSTLTIDLYRLISDKLNHDLSGAADRRLTTDFPFRCRRDTSTNYQFKIVVS